jgi:hypothetical protein
MGVMASRERGLASHGVRGSTLFRLGEEGGHRWFGFVLSWSWGAGVSGDTWGRTSIASVMALESRSPRRCLRKNKYSFCHGPGKLESWRYLGKNKIASAMALGSRIPQGYLKGKNSFLVSAKVIWSIFVALKRRVVHNKAPDKQVPFLIMSFLGSHQGFVQSSGSVAMRKL